MRKAWRSNTFRRSKQKLRAEKLETQNKTKNGQSAVPKVFSVNAKLRKLDYLGAGWNYWESAQEGVAQKCIIEFDFSHFNESLPACWRVKIYPETLPRRFQTYMSDDIAPISCLVEGRHARGTTWQSLGSAVKPAFKSKFVMFDFGNYLQGGWFKIFRLRFEPCELHSARIEHLDIVPSKPDDLQQEQEQDRDQDEVKHGPTWRQGSREFVWSPDYAATLGGRKKYEKDIGAKKLQQLKRAQRYDLAEEFNEFYGSPNEE
jgi:hypothetical protein